MTIVPKLLFMCDTKWPFVQNCYSCGALNELSNVNIFKIASVLLNWNLMIMKIWIHDGGHDKGNGDDNDADDTDADADADSLCM